MTYQSREDLIRDLLRKSFEKALDQVMAANSGSIAKVFDEDPGIEIRKALNASAEVHTYCLKGQWVNQHRGSRTIDYYASADDAIRQGKEKAKIASGVHIIHYQDGSAMVRNDYRRND